MTPTEVSLILGNCDRSETGSAGTLTTYRWEGPNGARIVATFDDDRLVSKNQFGLK